ncbi:MerR family transcriptional regulator [Planomonospora venezuelensis]|uniref:DNA-binding transcriptional MerR regulator n=1 Tax=Planomonospora venezuelensis TaxID=1999 RepID=A0A841D9I8_PLAVE|nr:MerR family transcriptional regulator [Planomonospora venezuelensis]MBB5965513.1 DNA-binding transcriptional MerR regulator [Planomonospora venezuelensis]GIN03356.1 MerR family transcriptional regulator [Planomonospora venezuelensis]
MDERPTTQDEPGYGIGAVARRLGVPAPTLRTWNLRYGLGPSRRSPGGHRRYDAGDLRRLEEMNRLIRSGVPAADAAKLVLGPGFARNAAAAPAREEPAHEAPAEDTPAAGTAGEDGPAAGAPAEDTPAAGASGRGAEEHGALSRHAPGRFPVPEPRHEVPSAAMLARSAIALDSPALSGWIGAALDRHGVVWTWERLVLPVFETICRRQAATGAAVEVEHVFSDRVLAALIQLARPPRAPVNDRPVLLACAEDEQHSLPIYALAAALTADHRIETRVLGARTPFSALSGAMRRLGPAVVFVWSQRPETGDPGPLTRLPVSRPASRVMAGGPGWQDGLPPSVPHVTSFRDALDLISSAVR